ncbi:MAG TPA: nickel pincer cofactor biosynthesis protein LarB [Candidatus Eisenbacteria bacterium]
MNEARLRKLLEAVRGGQLSLDGAIESLRHLPYEELPDLAIDHHRELRCGFPEVVFALGKSDAQVEAATRAVAARSASVLVTRVTPTLAGRLVAEIPSLRHDAEARAVYRHAESPAPGGRVAVVAAGTADVPVAAEAALTASLFGNEVSRVTDVGVAGLHRLLPRIAGLRRHHAVVVVAGMEGALPSVVAGLIDVPVIAVPTSVGYGASFGGVTALLGMLNSCAAGVTVVNIDNGYGAGHAAGLIARGRATTGSS